MGKYYFRLSNHRFESKFDFRYDSLIDAPHGVPNCAGEVEVRMWINEKPSKRLPTGLKTTNLIWDGRLSAKVSQKSQHLQQQLCDLKAQIDDSWYVLMKSGFEYNPELILKGIVQPSGRIKTDLAFRQPRPAVTFRFEFLPDPFDPAARADPFQPGEMVLNVLVESNTWFGPYLTGIRTNRAQAAAYSLAVTPSLEQIKLKSECSDLSHRLFKQLPKIYRQILVAKVDETALSLNLRPLQLLTDHA